MALLEKITQEDLYLYEIARNPVLFTEFIQNLDKLDFEKKLDLDDYQKEFVCDFSSHVSIACARAVGKSFALTNLIIWILVNDIFPSDYILYTVPSKVHLEPVWSYLVRFFRSNSFLKQFVDPKGGFNSSDFVIRLKNNTQLSCRIAGQTGTGANVVGLHTPFVILDESGYYPWGTWTEMQPIVNTFTSGYRLIVSGVPTGLRERNVCFHCDQENTNYKKHRISALQNPRFSEEDHERAIEQYGGTDTEDYIHLVLGEHGKPIFALFDRESMEISDYNVYQMNIDGTKFYDNIADYLNLLSVFPTFPDKKTQCIFGIDLGYTEPTAITILYLDRLDRFKFHGRIALTKVDYYIQEKLIDYLDSRFNPFIIGIDAGSAGKSVIPRLQGHDDFIHKDYDKRVVPVDFSSWTVLGTDLEGNEIKSKTKPFSVSLLQEYVNNHKIIFSHKDMDMIVELERMTYVKNPSGDISYRTLTEKGGKRGDDHFTSALLCATMAYYLLKENLDLRRRHKKLARPHWFVSG